MMMLPKVPMMWLAVLSGVVYLGCQAERPDEITYTTISNEILDTITLRDPNGIMLELSVWNIYPKDVQM